MPQPLTFPLLAPDPAPYLLAGRSYPRTFTFADGSVTSLFTGGVVTAVEIGQIARRTAARIAERYGGRRLLVVQVLEGARPFAAMVLSHLQGLAAASGIRYEVASVQVRSYGQGTAAAAHRVLQPLMDQGGRVMAGCGDFDGVVVVDDLIDGGQTVAWLVTDYLPALAVRDVGVCTMLVKERDRSPAVEEIVRGCLICGGQRVADEWLVGYGLDLALPGRGSMPASHLFRQALPGGIYACNRAIVQPLIAAYHADPDSLRRQLAIYLSPC